MPFPEGVRRLPHTELAGADVYVHDAAGSQILFIEVASGRPPVVVPTHTHDVEWGIVVEGEIEMTLGDRVERHPAGSTHSIPKDLPHSFRFAPGTSSVHYFVERRVQMPRAAPAAGH
jgi:quercetin dioxygenase-like cupin family protein